MSNVSLRIGGRTFTVACAEGEEDHIAGLGRLIDSRLASVEGASGQSESRMLLFAALLIADDLHEIRNQPMSSSAPNTPDPMLGEIARRLENLAARLEQGT